LVASVTLGTIRALYWAEVDKAAFIAPRYPVICDDRYGLVYPDDDIASVQHDVRVVCVDICWNQGVDLSHCGRANEQKLGLRALDTLLPLNTLGAFGTVRTSWASQPSVAYRPLNTSLSLDALSACWPLNAFDTLRPRWAFRACACGEAY